MFNPDFSHYYSERYEFIKFGDKNQITYLDIDLNTIHSEDYKFSNGTYRFGEDSLFKSIKLNDENCISLVAETEVYFEDNPPYIEEGELKYIKLRKTETTIDSITLFEISNYSEWDYSLPTQNANTSFTVTTWNKLSDKERQNVHKDKERVRSTKDSFHLMKVGKTILLIQEKLDNIKSKAIVLKLSEKELTLANHNNSFKELEFKRIKKNDNIR
jgi:hypothetical protein